MREGGEKGGWEERRERRKEVHCNGGLVFSPGICAGAGAFA